MDYAVQKKIVCLGGGNGTSHVIEGLKMHGDAYALSAVISMADSGGASGKLRAELDVLPPGDILRAIIAMSPHDTLLLKRVLYDTRYSEHGKLHGFGVGHLFLALAEKYNGGIVDAIRALAQALDVVGPVFPATVEKTTLCAELLDKTILRGEHVVDHPPHGSAVISRVFFDPPVSAYFRACDYIRGADVIVIGPGSLYTSVLPVLMPEGITEAISESSAPIVFVSNNGVHSDECGPVRLSEVVKIVSNLLPRPLSRIVSNSAVLGREQEAYYSKKGWKKIEANIDAISTIPVFHESFELASGGMDALALGRILNTVIKDL